eukprot:4833065-Prymnesium_polylepis.1
MCLGYHYSSESGPGSLYGHPSDELRTVSQYKIEADTVRARRKMVASRNGREGLELNASQDGGRVLKMP